MGIMARPFKVKLSDKAAKVLGEIAAEMKVERDNFQIGVGTISAELIESLTDNPKLLRQLLEAVTQQTKRADRKKLPAGH